MANLIVTFRIASDSGYQSRYDSFVAAAHELADGGVSSTWEETTSFLSFRVAGTAESVCQHLYLKSAFDSTKDVMVVIDIGMQKKAVKGPVNYLGTLTANLGF